MVGEVCLLSTGTSYHFVHCIVLWFKFAKYFGKSRRGKIFSAPDLWYQFSSEQLVRLTNFLIVVFPNLLDFRSLSSIQYLSTCVRFSLVNFRPQIASIARVNMVRTPTILFHSLYSLYQIGCLGLVIFILIKGTDTLSGLYWWYSGKKYGPGHHFNRVNSIADTPLDRRLASEIPYRNESPNARIF